MYCETLNEKEFFSESCADTLIVWVTYILVFQKMPVLQNIVLIQTMWILEQQKDKRP